MDNIFYFYRDFYESLIKNKSNMVTSIDDYDWYNNVYEGIYKWSHIEHYKTDKVQVLHIVTMPKAISGKPIFGLDVVAINGKITMVCADFTPTVEEYSNPHPFKNSRQLPDWADFFSSDLLLTTPEDQDHAKEILEYYGEKLKEYLHALENEDKIVEPVRVLESQNRYINNQRKNNKTFKALAANIGKTKAGKFIKEILFPEVSLDPREKEIQKIFDYGKSLRQETKTEHTLAERTDLSYNLITGNVSELHYRYYLQLYYNAFKFFKEKSKVCEEIFNYLEKDFHECKAQELEIHPELQKYLDYLQNNPEKYKGHIYTMGLGFCYGGKMIAKNLKFPKSHLENLPDRVAFEIRKETYGCRAENVKESFNWIYKIYTKINTI